ncbi:hypothetical protein FRC06_010772, partial [Ceratobasidium sp. 370]
TIKDDLIHLLNSIDNYQSKPRELYEMRAIAERCLQDTVQAQTTAGTLRFRHEELSYFFATQQATNNYGRALTFGIEHLYAVLYTWVTSIQESLQHLDRAAKTVPKPSKF